MSRILADAITAEIPRLRRYARALTGDPERADDLVQDCLERAWARQHHYDGSSELRPWLFTILHNLHANAARSYHRRPVFVDADALAEAGPVAPGHDGELALRDLGRAMERLSDEQRTVLLLVGVEELSYPQAAAVLGVPVGTVMSRLSRARERLRQLLAGAGGPRLRRVK